MGYQDEYRTPYRQRSRVLPLPASRILCGSCTVRKSLLCCCHGNSSEITDKRSLRKESWKGIDLRWCFPDSHISCKIWGFHSGEYEECRLLGYKNPVRTSQETHYFSTTEHSRLMLYKIWGFHGGDYEECRLVGYKNPVRTSQETHYFSATEHSQLMLCKIWGFHGGDYEQCRLLGYKNPVFTSQETHYFSATESSQLMLYKIWSFHGGNYEECRFLDIETQFVLHRRHFTSPLQSPTMHLYIVMRISLRWAQMLCTYIYASFHKDWFRNSKVKSRLTRSPRKDQSPAFRDIHHTKFSRGREVGGLQ
jgi:hypothetical protein